MATKKKPSGGTNKGLKMVSTSAPGPKTPPGYIPNSVVNTNPSKRTSHSWNATVTPLKRPTTPTVRLTLPANFTETSSAFVPRVLLHEFGPAISMSTEEVSELDGTTVAAHAQSTITEFCAATATSIHTVV